MTIRRLAPWIAFWIAMAPTVARADETTCSPSTEDKLKSDVTQYVGEIRIAQYRADMSMMDQRARDLEKVLEACKGNAAMLARICDSECHLQRASVHLFRASALPLLSSKGPTSVKMSSVPQDQQKEAQAGLDAVETALHNLPRTQGFDTTGTVGLNRYLKAYARLRALQVKLLNTMGDVWYRQASTAQSKALSYLVSSTLGDVGRPDDGKGTELYNASAYYTRAYWVLVDAKSSLPGDLANSQLFATELSDLGWLEQEVGRRLQSVREGKLYIGIDPGDMGSGENDNFLSLSKLSEQLGAGRDALARSEAELDDTMKEWASKAAELQRVGDERESLRSSRAIDLQVYKIQEIQDLAASFKEEIRTKLEAIKNEQNTYELKQKIIATQLELERAKREFENQLVIVQNQTEQDLLSLNKERIQQQIEDIRFDIDMTLADFNFDMQIRSLQREQAELVRQRTSDEYERSALVEQERQVDQQVNTEQLRVSQFNVVINGARQRQSELIKDQIAVLEYQIGGVDADLEFYNANPELIGKICDARSELAKKGVEDLKALKACLKKSGGAGHGDGAGLPADGSGGGGGCAGTALSEVYEKLRDKKKESLKAQKTKTDAMLQPLNDRLTKLDQVASTWDNRVANWTAGVEGAYVVAGVAAAVPRVAFGWAGVGPFESTDIVTGIAEGLRITADALNIGMTTDMEGMSFHHGVDQEKVNLQQTIAELKRESERLGTEQGIEDLACDQALADLSVRLLEADKEIHEFENTAKVQAAECDRDAQQANATIKRLKAEKESLKAQITVQNDESNQLDFTVREQETLIAQAQSEMQRLAAQKSELGVHRAKWDADINQIDAIIASVGDQLGSAQGFQRKVDLLRKDNGAAVQSLRDHIEKISFAITNASETQKNFIRSAMDDASKIAFQDIETLKGLIAYNDSQGVLLGALNDIELKARAQVQQSRSELYGLVAAIPGPTSDKVIWDFENLAADLTRGAPEMLEFKRSVLENINYYYNRYRYRYNLLSEFINRTGIPDDDPLIWTADDATRKLSYCSKSGMNSICQPGSIMENGTAIHATNSLFTIDATSSMFQDLKRDGVVRFEISPYGRSKLESARKGHYVLWDEENMSESRELRLIGFSLGFSGRDCTPTLTTIRHLGYGYQYGRLSETSDQVVLSMVVKKPVRGRPAIYTQANTPNIIEAMRTETAEFTSASYSVLGLDNKLHADGLGGMDERLYPFAGYPLVATYEMRVDAEEADKCLSQMSEMTLNIIYAKR